MFIDRVRPPEWLHEKRCLAAAMIAAVENLRDVGASIMNDHGFRIAMQEGYALRDADSYLNEGIMTCTCTAPWPEDVEAALTEEVQRQPQCWRQVVARYNTEMHDGHEFLVP